jgi:hypothetical protein
LERASIHFIPEEEAMVENVIEIAIPPEALHARTIHRITTPEGPIYRHPISGKPIKVHEEDLTDVVNNQMEKLRILTDLLSDDDFSRFGFVFRAVLDGVEGTLRSICQRIKEDIGGLELATIGHDQFPYRTDAVVGAKLQPAQ